MLYEFSNNGIYIRHAVDNKPDDSHFNMHIHEQCEIYYFVSGSVEYIVEGSRYLLEDNSLLLMRPAEAHRAKIIAPTKYERYALNFPLDYFRNIDPENHLIKSFMDRPLGSGNLYTIQNIDTRMIRHLLQEICESNTSYTANLSMNTHLPIILDMISRAFSHCDIKSATTSSVKEQIVAYVNSHLCDEISIPTLANCFYLSPSQFSRIFKDATGAAPWEYITSKRLIIAKEKIQNGCSAQSACEQCGFSDYSSFYRAYKKFWGASPKSNH